MSSLDLTRLAFVRRLLVARGPQLAVQLALLAGLLIVILAGLLGTPVGSRNPATVLVWIAWWAALMLAFVPWLGRSWCSVCPLPLPGEWLQRGALLAPRGRGLGLGLRWPRRLRGMGLQNAAFLLVALFSLPVLTQPRLTAALLLGLGLLAIATSLVFERRAFCRYLCPVGGFIGLYAQAAPVALRVRDPRLCATHAPKTCYVGSAHGYGCPWQAYPPSLTTNVSCGLCLECLRTCPYDNIGVFLRPPGEDLRRAWRSLGEALKSLILLGSALVYAVVLLGPWNGIRSAAVHVGSAEWFAFAVAFLAVVLGVVPGLFLLAVRVASGPRAESGDALRRLAPSLVPLGLAAWAAFSVSFVLANISYIGPVASDPLSLGWNLFGTAGVAWSPLGGGWTFWLPPALLAGGLAWSSHRIRRAADGLQGGLRLAAPMLTLALTVSVGMLWVFVG